jgi:hypothetical protein
VRSLVRSALALALAATVLGGVAVAADEQEFAPLDRPGPRLSVPAAELAASLDCTGDLRSAALEPVLLVPGTNLDPEPNFSWNYARAFTADGRPFCTVTLPSSGLADIQVAGEFVVHALRTMAQRSGRQVDVVGYSQGGMLPRWALRFWPDTRRVVDDLVGLAPSNHGTLDSEVLCQAACPPAYWQQATSARFVEALNSRAETFAGIDYTVVYTRYDQVVTPNLDDSGSSALHTGSGRIVNVATQDVCPANTADHLAVGSYDAVGYALAVDALDAPGPADPVRVDRGHERRRAGRSVDPLTFPADHAGLLAAIGRSAATGPQAPAEPELRPYVFAQRR